MRRRSLRWLLFPTYLLVIVATLFLTGWIAATSLQRFHQQRTAADLETRARLVREALDEIGPAAGPDRIDALCKSMGGASDTRITVIATDGRVIGDSDQDPAGMDNHAGRPEIQDAIAGGVGLTRRYSHTLQTEMLYLALPASGGVIVRAALPLTVIHAETRAVLMRMLIGGLGVAVLAVLLSLLITRRLAGPIESVREAAGRFARGQLDHRLLPVGSREESALMEDLNRMASQLGARIGELERRNREQAALFGGMIEGVVAVDADERIITINPAGARLFGVTPDTSVGRHLQEVIRNSTLQRFVRSTLEAQGVTETELVIRDTQDTLIQARGTVLRGPEGQEKGVLIVLNDVTRLRRLENVRRDFVANVSHELRTPVTSIKGFLETLQDSGLDDPREARRFVAIAARQADRLDAIIEDLLVLSRIEQDSERADIGLETGPIRPVLEAAIEVCQVIAAERKVSVELSCADDLEARHNAALLEQAVSNLVDNAIKYSSPDGTVRVEAGSDEAGVFVRVVDRGVGIPAEHLERLFERFYTVDRARSRRLGGTGLGLAIVKHIVLAHGGSVHVESQPGSGSVFTIRLVGDRRA